MRLAITICATKSYTYAQIAQARRLQAAIAECGFNKVAVILVGDGSEECDNVERFYKTILPEGCELKCIAGQYQDGLENYDFPAQLVIARMRSAAFTEARRWGVDYCLSMDSDVLPPANAIRVMKQVLEFDDGYYSVAQCPYPSQGGGDFLGGRGTPQNPILPDRFDEDYNLSDEVFDRVKKHRQLLIELNGVGNEEWSKERTEIAKLYKEASPKGDVFFLNSSTGVTPFVQAVKERMEKCGVKDEVAFNVLAEMAERWKPGGFRKRGWHSSAYPAIGKGAVVPIDWVGFGCTMMNKEALGLAQFDGYEGGGTEDLYIVWKRWYRAGLRLASVAHCPCDHVIRNRDQETAKKQPFILLQAHHDSEDKECEGHLRIEQRPWFQQVDGETALKTKKQQEEQGSSAPVKETAPAAQA